MPGPGTSLHSLKNSNRPAAWEGVIATDDFLRVSPQAAPVRALVLERLRAAIVQRRFEPGERLVERRICDLTGVSRTSVREALRQLESEGLVEVIPNRGPIVAQISVRDAEEIYQVRAVLEGLAGRLCALRRTDDQARELQRIVDEMDAHLASQAVEEQLEAKDRFYGALFHAAGNSLVGKTLGGLHARATFLRATTLSQPSRPQQTVAELREVVVAIAARDPDRAERACRLHVESAARVALAALAQDEQ